MLAYRSRTYVREGERRDALVCASVVQLKNNSVIIIPFFTCYNIRFVTFLLLRCSASLQTYAHDDTSVGSWMMGIDATYVDDDRLCCGSSRQGIFYSLAVAGSIYAYSDSI